MTGLKALLNDWFLRGMITAVIIASFFPDIGKSGGMLHIDHFLNAGVALVFFLHGMGIPTGQLRAGLKNWRLHIVVQLFTFVLFPLLFIVFRFTLGHWLPPMLLLGFFYLCVLPSTITSSVAMTGLARGNVPAAIFNATLSSLIGIVLTPLLVSLMATTSGAALPFGQAVTSIATLLLLPFVLGQLLHPVLGKWLARHKKTTSLMDRSIILLLVFSSFCDSVAAGLWSNYGVSILLLTLAGAASILTVVLFLTWQTARALKFTTEDEIVAVFCGSKKTLAAGIPMAKVLFGAHPGLGLIVLPVMFYHQLQLIACSALAQRYARRPDILPVATGAHEKAA
ncbi:MAG: bile acid:sodium symporter [bacterium]|nr:bile acid:sodium symporter [bacterium]